MGCYIRYSEDGTGRAAVPPSPLLAVPNVTAHPPTASVPIGVLLYDGPLLCGFNVAIKGLSIETAVQRVQIKLEDSAFRRGHEHQTFVVRCTITLTLHSLLSGVRLNPVTPSTQRPYSSSSHFRN